MVLKTTVQCMYLNSYSLIWSQGVLQVAKTSEKELPSSSIVVSGIHAHTKSRVGLITPLAR